LTGTVFLNNFKPMSFLAAFKPVRQASLCYTFLFAGLFFFHAGFGQNLLTTVAGIADQAGFSGDGGVATQAKLNSPTGVCFDAAGNMYIADYLNHRVRKVDGQTGNISTIAGTGTAGFSGDGGPAINAMLDQPARVMMDQNNTHLFIVDYLNLRVRVMDMGTGIISTIAGDGTQNYVNGGLAVNGGILPFSIAMDKAGNLYISQHAGPLATYTTNIISKLDMKTGIITTVAGNGVFGFGGDGGPAVNANLWNPGGMAFDAAGNLYFADLTNVRVRRVDAVTGIITTVAGGGTIYQSPDGISALTVAMKLPIDVMIDGNGNLIVSDELDERIRVVNLTTGIISTIAGNAYVGTSPDCIVATNWPMNDCEGMAVNGAGELYFAETAAHRVRKVFSALSNNAKIVISTQDNPLCNGHAATFTAQVSNAGTGPAFQWKVNGKAAGNNSSTFTIDGLNNGDIVSCELNYSAGGTCVNSAIQSNNITMQITTASTPSISISTPYSTICSGGDAEFTATALAAGASPVYQWLVNGAPVGGNTSVYDATGLANNDVVQCRLTADPTAKCTSMTPVTSLPVSVKVLPGAGPSIQVNASAQQICPGDNDDFTAVVQNAGDGYSLQWLVNGNKVGGNKESYSSTGLGDGDVVTCVLTPGAGSCMAGQGVSSNKTIISVSKLPAIGLGFTDTTVLPGVSVSLRCTIQGSVQSWQWSPGDKISDVYSLTPVTIPLIQTTSFRFTAYSAEGCPTYKDALVRVYYQLSMPNSFTPNGDGKNDVFRIPPAVTLDLDEFAVFDRWGNTVFSTKDISKGWDGTWKGQPSAPGVYVYLVKGKSIKGEVLSKGTVILVR
jgi:gliding motility-associated-like protein